MDCAVVQYGNDDIQNGTVLTTESRDVGYNDTKKKVWLSG